MRCAQYAYLINPQGRTVTMQTASSLSTTVRLSNEEIGSMHRRVYEIVRRIEEGTIPYQEAATGLQRIIERKQQPTVQYSSHARPRSFPHTPRHERRRSHARLSIRLPQALTRLRWHERNPERIIAELWEIECIPEACTNYGRTNIHAIMGEDMKFTSRDVQVINSTIQWLGTNCGMEFLRKFLGVSQIYVN
jgi:hypothetical protein